MDTKNHALAKIKDDRQWLPKNDSSISIKRSVVHITVPVSPENFGRERHGAETGTGIIIQRKANRTLILTNRHVVFDGNQQSKTIRAEFFSQPPKNNLRMRRDVKLLKSFEDKKLDIAVLEVIGTLPEDIQPLPIYSNPIALKTDVNIIGHSANNQEQLWSVESRKISNYSKQKLQISKPKLQLGYSGSPVTDSRNQLVGIVFARDKSQQENLAYPMSVILQQLRTWKVL